MDCINLFVGKQAAKLAETSVLLINNCQNKYRQIILLGELNNCQCGEIWFNDLNLIKFLLNRISPISIA